MKGLRTIGMMSAAFIVCATAIGVTATPATAHCHHWHHVYFGGYHRGFYGYNPGYYGAYNPGFYAPTYYPNYGYYGAPRLSLRQTMWRLGM